jgi:hypothetical protein
VATDQVVALAALVLLAAAVCRWEVRRSRAARATRDGLFDAVLEVVDDARLTTGPQRYPVLTGRHRGHPVRVEAVVDTLTMRKLPILWVFVTIRRPFGLDSPVDALARPIGTEFFSPNASFRHLLPTPPDFPVHARIAAERPTVLGPAVLATIGELMRDAHIKEILAGPTGARIGYQLAEATQGPYRTGRRADFGAPRLEPRTLAGLLDGLDALGAALTPERTGSP